MVDKELLKEEVEELRKRGHQFVAGELSRADLKGFSGGLGSYSQKETGKFMIRLKTPSGIISRDHWKRILGYAREQGLEKIHLTTRQAIQLHELSIDGVCDIMADAIDHDLFTRGGGGNFPRNVTLSPMAGVDPKEAFDVTPFALLVGNYFLERAVTYRLPRKLKVAFSSSMEDTGCATINDLGFIAAEQDGKAYFKLYLAGGMGGAPAIAIPYEKPVRPEEVLYYVEAMVNLFMAEGDYENKAKARTRFIPRRMGTEAFLQCYEQHVEKVKAEQTLPEIPAKPEAAISWSSQLAIPDVVKKQKQKGRYTVVIHPRCGQLFVKDAEIIEAFLEAHEEAELRSSMNEDLYVRNLKKEEAEELLALTEAFNETTMGGKTLTCIGVPSCQIGIQKSQRLTEEIIKALTEADLLGNYLPRIQVNGCQNSCSRHPAAMLGFAGRKKKVGEESKDCFDFYAGGRVGADAKLAELQGAMLAEQIPQFVTELAGAVKAADTVFEDFMDTEAYGELVRKYLV